MADPLRLPAQAYVYVIGSADGPQKIGVANDPQGRRMSLQGANSLGLLVAGAIPATRGMAFEIEAYAHWLLRDFRVRGEWFDVTPQAALDAIGQAAVDIASGKTIPARLPAMVDSEYQWQTRLKRAGLSQKMLARLLGVAENTVSLQLRGKWQSGVPGYVKTVIRMWELLPQKDRETIMDAAED